MKIRRCEDENVKMRRSEVRRCEDEKMRDRPPLLEEPCAQTLSGQINHPHSVGGIELIQDRKKFPYPIVRPVAQETGCDDSEW